MKFQKKYWSVPFLAWAMVLVCASSANAQFYRGSQQEYGKNRVQYAPFNWTYYQFSKYRVYFHTGGIELANYSAKGIQAAFAEMESRLDYQFEGRANFIVYNKIEEFRQSNIGLNQEDDYNLGGAERFQGDKVFLYFEGNHENLNFQIKKGVADIVSRKVLYGNDWKEVIKNTALLNIPNWYTDGLTSHLAAGWTPTDDDNLRDLMLNKKYKNLQVLLEYHPELGGKAIWNYLQETYGSRNIANILYMTRISRNVESGFLFVIGFSLEAVLKEIDSYYMARYQVDDNIREMPENELVAIKTKGSREVRGFTSNSDGQKLAYATSDYGKLKVFVFDKSTGKTSKVFKEGKRLERLQEKSYPLIAWHPDGEALAIIYEADGQVQLSIYNTSDKSVATKPIFRLDKILSFDWSADGKEMVFSAMRSGKSDIYLYRIRGNSQDQITDDFYDDLNPSFILNSSAILFSSNRETDTLRHDISSIQQLVPRYDLWQYDLNGNGKTVSRITNTPAINETKSADFRDNKFFYLSDQSGILNRYLAQRDSAISFIDTTIHYRYFTNSEPVTNYKRNIRDLDVNQESETINELLKKDRKYRVFATAFDATATTDKLLGTLSNTDGENALSESLKTIDLRITVSPTFYENPFRKDNPNRSPVNFYELSKQIAEEKKSGGDSTQAIRREPQFELPQQRNYNINFTSTDISMKMDFDFDNDVYQLYSPQGFVNPGAGGYTHVAMFDLFEDYMVEGGFRWGFGSGNNDYFVSLEDRSKRLDKKYVLQRRTTEQNGAQFMTKTYMLRGSYILKYPFNEVSAIRSTISLRNDREVTMGTERRALEQPDDFIYWGHAKLEYIYDDSKEMALNIRRGARAKVFGEVFRDVNTSQSEIFVVGFDARHYTRIYKRFIWANRIAASNSFGSRRLVYYMGSVDEWIVFGDREQFNQDQQIDPEGDQNYYFQTTATPMRGFIRNARNGNTFAVLNSELRCPIFNTFSTKPLSSEFIDNFQLVLFGDIGSAWNGRNPYSEQNTFNQKIWYSSPNNTELSNTIVTYQNNVDPFIGSFGTGVRTKLWGYFMKLDFAWGIEDGRIIDQNLNTTFKNPMTHFSLGLDF